MARQLTSGEAALAREALGQDFDAGPVRILAAPWPVKRAFVIGRWFGRDWIVWPRTALPDDIAAAPLGRQSTFIHELTHLKPRSVPGFRAAWNLLIGIPLLVPSFLYEGVHNQHHAKRYYGTANDPEYLPLALMKPWTLPVFLIAAALAPGS